MAYVCVLRMEERKEKKNSIFFTGKSIPKKENPRSSKIKVLFRDIKINNETGKRD